MTHFNGIQGHQRCSQEDQVVPLSAMGGKAYHCPLSHPVKESSAIWWLWGFPHISPLRGIACVGHPVWARLVQLSAAAICHWCLLLQKAAASSQVLLNEMETALEKSVFIPIENRELNCFFFFFNVFSLCKFWHLKLMKKVRKNVNQATPSRLFHPFWQVVVCEVLCCLAFYLLFSYVFIYLWSLTPLIVLILGAVWWVDSCFLQDLLLTTPLCKLLSPIVHPSSTLWATDSESLKSHYGVFSCSILLINVWLNTFMLE